MNVSLYSARSLYSGQKEAPSLLEVFLFTINRDKPTNHFGPVDVEGSGCGERRAAELATALRIVRGHGPHKRRVGDGDDTQVLRQGDLQRLLAKATRPDNLLGPGGQRQLARFVLPIDFL
jgi:hypothetical protein